MPKYYETEDTVSLLQQCLGTLKNADKHVIGGSKEYGRIMKALQTAIDEISRIDEDNLAHRDALEEKIKGKYSRFKQKATASKMAQEDRLKIKESLENRKSAIIEDALKQVKSLVTEYADKKYKDAREYDWNSTAGKRIQAAMDTYDAMNSILQNNPENEVLNYQKPNHDRITRWYEEFKQFLGTQNIDINNPIALANICVAPDLSEAGVQGLADMTNSELRSGVDNSVIEEALRKGSTVVRPAFLKKEQRNFAGSYFQEGNLYENIRKNVKTANRLDQDEITHLYRLYRQGRLYIRSTGTDQDSNGDIRLIAPDIDGHVNAMPSYNELRKEGVKELLAENGEAKGINRNAPENGEANRINRNAPENGEAKGINRNAPENGEAKGISRNAPENGEANRINRNAPVNRQSLEEIAGNHRLDTESLKKCFRKENHILRVCLGNYDKTVSYNDYLNDAHQEMQKKRNALTRNPSERAKTEYQEYEKLYQSTSSRLKTLQKTDGQYRILLNLGYAHPEWLNTPEKEKFFHKAIQLDSIPPENRTKEQQDFLLIHYELENDYVKNEKRLLKNLGFRNVEAFMRCPTLRDENGNELFKDPPANSYEFMMRVTNLTRQQKSFYANNQKVNYKADGSLDVQNSREVLNDTIFDLYKNISAAYPDGIMSEEIRKSCQEDDTDYSDLRKEDFRNFRNKMYALLPDQENNRTFLLKMSAAIKQNGAEHFGNESYDFTMREYGDRLLSGPNSLDTSANYMRIGQCIQNYLRHCNQMTPEKKQKEIANTLSSINTYISKQSLKEMKKPSVKNRVRTLRAFEKDLMEIQNAMKLTKAMEKNGLMKRKQGVIYAKG